MLIHPNFDPIALQIGPLAIRWYGLMYLIAFGAFYALGYLQHPLEALAIWHGGMSFHGGLIGVLIACAIFARRRGMRFLDLMDFVAPLVPVGLAAGRLGNFINGELWGRVTDVSWGMVFPQSGSAAPRHPSQLYQFAGEGLLLFAFIWWFSSRQRPTGAVSGAFLIGYGVLRFLAEFAREPDEFLGLVLGPFTMGQMLCVPMVAAGIWLVMRSRSSPSARAAASSASGPPA